MQWKNPDGSITTGVVIEDGAGDKITSFSGGGGSGSNFTPNGATAQLSVSTASARTALPGGVTIMVYNTGSQAAFVALGSNTVTATTANDEIPAGGAVPFTPSTNTYLAAITASGSTSLNITGGSNLGFPLSGVGSGGGGSNASVGATGLAAPSSATEVGFIDGSGNLRAPSKTYPMPETLTDASSGNQAAVLAFHNTDNQILSGTTYGLNTGGVAQLINAAGGINRQRETSVDGAPPVGVAAGAQQLAGPPLGTTVTSGAITGSTSPQTITLAAVTFTNRGVTTNIQVGSILLVDTGASQEAVFVSTVNTAGKTVTGIFKNSHSAAVTISLFAYNQARDATIPDGSTPAGIAASAAYFFNAPTQTVEMERSAAGELDGASGTGIAVAAEYEWNGGGPLTSTGAISGLAFDRARNLQGKGAGGSTLNGAVLSGATSITLNAVAGLNPGQQIRLDAGVGAEESSYVAQNYTPGSLTVALQAPLANAHANGGGVAWDAFASAGPGLNGFTPTGIGIEEEALYDPVSAKYYIERAATQDGCAPQNVVIENCGLWNGSSIDRLRSVSGDAMSTTGLEASVDLLWNGTSYDRPREVSGDGQGATGIPAEALMLWNGATYDRAYGDKTNGLFVNVKQMPALAASATPTAASSLVLKSATGNLVSLMATSTAAGWLMLFDATSAPADGAVTPKWAYPIAANGALNMAWPNPLAFATGIVAVFSSTGPFTKTASATAFISGQAQ